MRFAIRLMMTAAMIVALTPAAFGQQASEPAPQPSAPSQPTTTAQTSTAVDETADATPSSYEIRNQFASLLRQSPDELSTILLLDPTLMSNEGFLNGYPELARFVERHPEVRRNPRFYLGDFAVERPRRSAVSEIFEALSIIAVVGLIAFALAWLVRAVIEQKRWNRLSRTQSEVHNKILDRFASSEELLTYIKTPAGSKFLESAPIPLRAEPPVQNAPVARILWSIQLGVVILAGGLGMLFVSLRFEKDTAEGFFALGAIAASIGLGFIVSAFTSLLLSRRLGLWKGDGPQGNDVLADPGVMR
jgi:hypothetical protein